MPFIGSPSRSILLALVALGLFTEAILFLGSATKAPATLDVGGATDAYLSGFGGRQVQGRVTFRWTRDRVRAELPLVGAPGRGILLLRYARFVPEPVRIRVFVSGSPVGAFDARPGGFRVERLPYTFIGGSPRVTLLAEDAHGSDASLAVDWIRFEGRQWGLPLSLVAPRLLVLGLFVLGLLVGYTPWRAFGLGASLAMAAGTWAAVDPFGLAHVSSRSVLPTLVLTAAGAAFVPQGFERRWLLVPVAIASLLRGAVLFYPSYFHPEVERLHHYHQAFSQAEGDLVLRGRVAQIQANLAYPRSISGETIALPYSPLFFVPFSTGRSTAEPAMKNTALVASTLEVVAVAGLGRLLFGASVGILSALLAAVSSPVLHGLLMVQWPAVTAHLFTVLAVLVLSVDVVRPSPRARAAFAVLASLACFLYLPNLVALGSLTAVSAHAQREKALQRIGAFTVAALPSFLLFGWPFTRWILAKLPQIASTLDPGLFFDGMMYGLNRIPASLGSWMLAVALVGMVLSRQRAPTSYRWLLGYGLAWVVMAGWDGFREGSIGILAALLIAGPWITVAAAVALQALRTRWGEIVGTIGVLGLVLSALLRFVEAFRSGSSLTGIG